MTVWESRERVSNLYTKLTSHAPCKGWKGFRDRTSEARTPVPHDSESPTPPTELAALSNQPGHLAMLSLIVLGVAVSTACSTRSVPSSDSLDGMVQCQIQQHAILSSHVMGLTSPT